MHTHNSGDGESKSCFITWISQFLSFYRPLSLSLTLTLSGPKHTHFQSIGAKVIR